MIKSFTQVQSESTCKKRITVCEIYDQHNNILSRESNRCNPKDGICQRMGIVQDKSNYDTESTCNWTHAEINTIKALPENSIPYRAVIYNHSFFCQNCEDALRKVGVKIFEIA